MVTADHSQSGGKQRLLRRLFATSSETSTAKTSTGTQPLGTGVHPGVRMVADSTLNAIAHLSTTYDCWDTHLLFGNAQHMTAVHGPTRKSGSFDVLATLAESKPALSSGEIAVARQTESRTLMSRLEMNPAVTVVYLVPLRVNGLLGGLIVIGVNSGLHPATLDGLRAIAGQSGMLMEAVQLTEGLKQREAGYRALVQNASDLLLVVNPNLTIVDLATTASVMLGYHPEELIGEPVTTFLHANDHRSAIAAIEEIAGNQGASPPLQWRLRCKDGSWIHVEVVGNNLLNNPGISGIVLIARDVSQRKALEASILHQVMHDELTGLPNRTAFMKHLENALGRRKHDASSLAVLFLDLDRFKVVNDSLGHEAGNQLLVQVARRLRESVRPEDTVARLSGDEFAVMIDHISGPEPAIDIARKILFRLKEAIRIDSHEVFVSTSIGIAIESTGGGQVTATTVLRNADLAMYEAKNGGRNGYTVYHPLLAARAVERLAMETELRYAVNNDEFQVFYQPLIDLHTGQVDEVEALVRWMHPSRGLLLPDSFIALAEETGLIEPIGQWVLEEVCRQSRIWTQQRPGAPPLHMNVNLSVRQFQQTDLVRDVQRTLRSSRVDPRHLTLEITESVALEDAEGAVATMHELKQLGIQLALDDFGTGYSALNYLKQFPVDALKIDRSFIEGLHFDHGDVAIVKAVIAFAKTLNLSVTAEGVETPDQLRHLRLLGCDRGQGFYFATPLPGMDLALDSQYGSPRLALMAPEQDRQPRLIHRLA
jgi:diguanylate cyclase (GGDEF)-like protein/PAS domain S-box-containing protein